MEKELPEIFESGITGNSGASVEQLGFDGCTMMPNTRPLATQALQREMRVPSVGPFELTEVEFIGLEFMRQDDERQLRKTTLRATWSGGELQVKAGEQSTSEWDRMNDIYSRILPY